MFGISLFELCVIAGIALLVLGPEKLPEVMHKIGKISGQLKRQSDSLRRDFYNSVYKPVEESQFEVRRAANSLRTLSNEIKSELSPSSAGLLAEPKEDKKA